MAQNLSGFLKPTVTETTASVMVSKRFVDEDGNPIPFLIKTISQEVNEKLIKKHTKPVKSKNGTRDKLDSARYQNELVVLSTVQPDFSMKDICDAYGVIDPMDVPKKMLLMGEFANLTKAIMDLNGFKDEEELEEEAKNS